MNVEKVKELWNIVIKLTVLNAVLHERKEIIEIEKILSKRKYKLLELEKRINKDIEDLNYEELLNDFELGDKK